MNSLVLKYFENNGFDEVVFLNEVKNASWEDFSNRTEMLPRGWFELSQLCQADRIEFTTDFWLSSFTFHPERHYTLGAFFKTLEDVGPVVFCKDGCWDAEMVYSLKDDSCFFRGRTPLKMPLFDELRKEFAFEIPRDYRAFLKMHNGFGKLSEMGILSFPEIKQAKERLVRLILESETPVITEKGLLDPRFLLPFYEEQGLSSFQCFYADWFPENEMGNVYFSGIDYTISKTYDQRRWLQELAFPTFLQWLTYYLMGMSTL